MMKSTMKQNQSVDANQSDRVPVYRMNYAVFTDDVCLLFGISVRSFKDAMKSRGIAPVMPSWYKIEDVCRIFGAAVKNYVENAKRGVYDPGEKHGHEMRLLETKVKVAEGDYIDRDTVESEVSQALVTLRRNLVALTTKLLATDDINNHQATLIKQELSTIITATVDEIKHGAIGHA